MNALAIITVALFMAAMVASAILSPVRLLRFVGSETLGRDGRNEVRAVYGGFGFIMFGLLVYTVQESAYRPGILFCIGLALVSMGGGRIISCVLDRGISPLMIVLLTSELAGGAALLFAI